MRYSLLIPLLWLASCVPQTQRAHLHHLQYRAVFDLSCHAALLSLYHVDARTKVVVGCGRRLVYQEDCARTGGSITCTWRIDTPIAEQWSWPRVAPEPIAEAKAEEGCPGRPIKIELFGSKEQGEREIIRDSPWDEDPLPAVPLEPPAQGRRIFDELETRR